ncbi:MAG: alkaline phosphatase family protein [Cyclobacteriaceae bacterium]|nr:alkaline phosphatase family protein [Cyclobacteriaceae bacterium]
MKSLWLALALLFCSTNLWAQSKETIIAFGSCDDEDEPQEMWKEVIAQKPSMWIWGGDNVYADTHDMILLKAKYDKQKSNPDYQKLMRMCTITGTWDDHDFGVNDGGKLYGKKNDSKKYLLDFLGIAEPSPVYEHEGVYNSLTIGKGNQKIKIINLDTRSFRDTVIKVFYIDSLTNKKMTHYEKNLSGDVLGDAQWQWLSEELSDASVGLFIINSSIQVIAAEHRFEKWANFPAARKRFLDVIAASKKRVVIVSGDRHIAEFSKIELPGMKYPLIDFTSSGITHTWSESWVELNKYRVGDLVIQKTFGLLKINWTGKEPKVTMQVRGLAKASYAEYILDFNLYR